MEKRKPINDPMMAVKAAAWAWYQRGSGSDLANTAREYDATRRRHGPPKPSRYKLEAMRSLSSNTTVIEPTQRREGSDNVPLLDEYEIRRISRQLDSLIEHSNNTIARENYVSSSDDESFASTSSSAATKIKRTVKRMLMRGFWMRHAAAVCGVRDCATGVVATATVRVFRDSRGVTTVTRRF